MLINTIIIIVVLLFAVVIVLKGVKVVPQSMVYVIERFGKYTRTLPAGLNLIIPFLDRVGHRVSIIERQLPMMMVSVITKDNVEVDLQTTAFFRVIEAEKSVYSIQNVDQAISTATAAIVRSASGKLELDELQSSRDSMNQEITVNLQGASKIWGLEITRSEIVDVIIDEQTKSAQRQQLNAERERRAIIAKAEGEKRSVELMSESELYQAQKNAEAIRVMAEAEAYAVRQKAAADAEQTEMLAKAIANDGQPAVDYEIRKRQVKAISTLAAAKNAKTIVLPTEVVSVLGAIESLKDLVKRKG